MKSLAFASVLLLLTLAALPQAQAQTQIEIGPRVGYEIDDFDALTLGGDIRVRTSALPVQLSVSTDYFFLSDGLAGDIAFGRNMWKFAFNGLFEFGTGNRYFVPYAGPGLAVIRRSRDFSDDNTDVNLGLHAVGGAEFGVGLVRPFVQAEFVLLGDVEPVQLIAGLVFTLGG